MNPANFQQAMMAGQHIPQGGNLSNQIKATLFARFQQQQNVNGWQSSLQPGERVNLVMQLTTSLTLAQPSMGQDNALKGALAFEAERFTRSANKEQYLASMRQQLQVLQQKRMQQSQNANLGQMGNPQVNMAGMMSQPMQANMSNQGNPIAPQFNPQLGRPMQVSPLPMNGQAPQGMQMAGIPNQNQGMQNPPPQQQGANAGGLSINDQQNINRIAQRLLQQASEEDKQRIMAQFSALPPPQQQQLRQRFGDPIVAHYRRTAQTLYKQMGNKVPNQGVPNGMPNNMMGQQTPMMQQPQMQMNGQPDGSVDFSQFMTQMQQEAIRSADSGQLVVPASNNAGMMGQNMNTMPMGLNGQMGNPGMNNANAMQNLMQQQQQRPAGMTPQQQQAAARLQAQMRSQAQNGQANQQNQMSAQMKMNTQSPMPQQRQPGMQPGQPQPGSTPQPQRPTPTPTPQMPQQPGMNPQMVQLMQQAAMNGQSKPVRRPLPNGLPPSIPQSLRDFLQTCDDDHFRMAIEQLRKQMGSQIQASVTNPMQANQMGQQPGPQNPMLNNGQNGQMNPAQMQQLRMAAAQQRANQAQAPGQVRPQGQIPQLVPEIIQKMDGQPFPRSILGANQAQMVPAHVTTFGQLKEFIIGNPAMAGQLTPMKLGVFQMDMWRRLQANSQMNGAIPQMGGPMNNGQVGVQGPAPTANMVPQAGVVNNMGQQPQQPNTMNAAFINQLQNVTVSPQDILSARQKNMFPPQMSDDEIRAKIVNIKRQRLMQNYQQQSRMMQMQSAQQQAGNNQLQNQRMVHNQMAQQPQQRPPMQGQPTPQMSAPTPTLPNKQPTPRPAQQQPPAGLKTPQQPAAKNLKRPAPEEVIEISDNSQTAPQAAAMQPTKSQQGRAPAAAAQGAPASDAAAQAILQRFGAILQEVKSEHQPRPALQLTEDERKQLQAKVEEYKQIITRTEYSIRTFFQGTRHEKQTKHFLQRYWHLADNVNPKEGVLLGKPTVRAADFEALVQPLKQLVLSIWKARMKDGVQKPQGAAVNQAAGQQTAGQQGTAQAASLGPQQLNAANLDQHNTNLRQQAAAQGHRRSSSKAQVPQAPTAAPGQNPFDFNMPSPHGVPKYGEGAGNLTPDKLNLPRNKKQKKDGQPPSNTPTPAQQGAGATASPHIGKTPSPQIKKQPVPEPPPAPQPPKNTCQDSTCEYSRKGFSTPEELAAHMQQVHAPPADPARFAMETLATLIGLNVDGSVKSDPEAKATQPAAGKSGVQIKAGTTPPSGATPLNKIPMKGSPAMDRLKTPQHPSKPPAPTSAAAPADKAHKQDSSALKADASANEGTGLDLLDFDLWKDSALQQNDLLEWLKPSDTYLGDWGNDRALRSPQLTPATTPDTNVTDKTASTRESEVLDGDGLNMTLAVNPLIGGDGGAFSIWKEVENWEPGIMDPDLMNDLAAVGIDEGMVLKLDETTNINDWEALFGPDSNIDGNKVPGWEGTTNELMF